MIIKLSKEEIKEFQNVMESAEPGSVDLFKLTIKDTKLVKFHLLIASGSVEIVINKDYTVEFLQTYARYVGLFVSQTRALFETLRLFNEEATKVINKYIDEDKPCCGNCTQE